ncbi:MAG TPA: hypothetical protein VF802_08845 [Candidatus Limnocylindrales bacterium]
MPPVRTIILHAAPGPDAGPLERLLADARAEVARSHLAAFGKAGSADVRLVEGPPDGLSFGERLASLLSDLPRERRWGVVVLGAGSIPLARGRDLRAFVDAAAAGDRRALANSRYSADVVAIARADRLPSIPPLPGDNALPRWLEEVAAWTVRALRRWRLGVDLDSPLDLLLVARARHGSARGPLEPAQPFAAEPFAAEPVAAGPFAAASDRLDAVRSVLADRRAQVVVAGRTGSRSLRWLERRTPARIRALIEERGLRASTALALAGELDVASSVDTTGARGTHARRPPRSILGLLLDREGPEALGRILGELGDAAIVDSRVLLAHRLGADEERWPRAEDRFASDLLDPGAVADPWLRALTASALAAPIPVLLGGHTLVGPGVRLVARPPLAQPRTLADRTRVDDPASAGT